MKLNGATGVGTWKGKVTPISTEPFAVQVTPQWDPDKFGTVDVGLQVSGPVQKVASRTTPVATVSLAWGNVSGKQLKKLPDKIPVFWNQASGTYEIANLPTPPVQATHLLFVTTVAKKSQTTFLPLADLPTTATLQIDKVAVSEPVKGTVNAVFTVTLTGQSLAPVTVKYQTVGDTATSGKDFTVVAGTLTFTPGYATTQKITVKIKSDKLVEDTEQFFVRLLPPNYGTLSTVPDQGIGTINTP